MWPIWGENSGKKKKNPKKSRATENILSKIKTKTIVPFL